MFVSTFLTSLIELILWLKFSIDQRQTEDMVEGGQGPQGLVLFSFINFTNDTLYNVCLGFTVYPLVVHLYIAWKVCFSYGWQNACVPPKVTYWSSNPQCDGRWLGSDEVMWVGPSWLVPLEEEISGSLCVLALSTRAHRVRSFQDAARGGPLSWKDSPHQKPAPPRALISDFQTPELWARDFLLFKRPVCSTLLWQGNRVIRQ